MDPPLTLGLSITTTTAAAATLALVSMGCVDLEHYSTGEGESYCGAITLGASFRQGLSPRVQMRLVLDTDELMAARSPGMLWTFESALGGEPERRLIDGAELRRIPAMEHDTLSQLSFGEGRVQNAIFAVSPSDPDAESMLAVLSLRNDDTVEIRLLRPGLGGDTAALPEGRRPLFGIFSLIKQVGTCGF